MLPPSRAAIRYTFTVAHLINSLLVNRKQSQAVAPYSLLRARLRRQAEAKHRRHLHHFDDLGPPMRRRDAAAV